MSFEEDDLRFSELEECSDGEDSDLDDVDLQQGLKGADDDETDLSLSASKSKPKVTGIKHLLDMKEALGRDSNFARFFLLPLGSLSYSLF